MAKRQITFKKPEIKHHVCTFDAAELDAKWPDASALGGLLWYTGKHAGESFEEILQNDEDFCRFVVMRKAQSKNMYLLQKYLKSMVVQDDDESLV